MVYFHYAMTLYQQLLQEDTELVLPWLGGNKVHSRDKQYRIVGGVREFGWYRWSHQGRKATVLGRADAPLEFNGLRDLSGYLVGHHFLADDTVVASSDINVAITQGVRVLMVEPGIERFSRVVVTEWFDGRFLFKALDMNLGPEFDVQLAYEDRVESVDHVAEVAPALDLAFRWETLRRSQTEERRRVIEEERRLLEEAERRRAEAEERQQEYVRQMTARAGSFEERARRALRMMGAELLDWRNSSNRNEMVVKYRFRNQRFECTCEADSLAIIDAGICLSGDYESGDRYFTLESLPSVIAWIIDDHGGLHRTRRV